MKKSFALFLTLILICTCVPFAATAETTVTLTPPEKVFYAVGEKANYSGGIYTYGETEFPLSSERCEGFETALAGIKTITVTIDKTMPKSYFNIVVLEKDEPILEINDIWDHQWFFEAFGVTMKAGLFTGDSTKSLRPNEAITRAEFASLIYRAWKSDPNVINEEYANQSEPFSDVLQTNWYYEAVEACRKAGILRGFEDGTCRPDKKISRQDAVLMLMRIQYSEKQLEETDPQALLESSGKIIRDFDDVSSYAKAAMALALGDLIQGDDTQMIHPQKAISRAEIATIFYRQFFSGYSWTAPEKTKPATPPETEEPEINQPEPNVPEIKPSAPNIPSSFKLSSESYTYDGGVKTPSVTIKDNEGHTLNKNTDYTLIYESGRKLPGKYTVTIKFKGQYSGTKKLYFTIAPKATDKITATQTTTTITLKWNKVTGASGYRVYKYNTKTKKFIAMKSTTATSLKFSDLKPDTTYQYKVRAYKKDGDTIWGEYSTTIKTTTKPKKMPLIFLSPSSQFANSYKGVKTNEGTQMNLLAQKIKKKLEAKGYLVYLPSTDLTYKERAELSNKVKADIHIPLHSNAGGKSTGTRIFYNGSIKGSKELSTAIFNRLGKLTNTSKTKSTLKEDYLCLQPNGTPFYEIKVPKAEMAYIEVEFHDKAEQAKWIVDNKDAMATAITNGIIAYCEKYLI